MATNFPASLDVGDDFPNDVGANETLAERVHHQLHNNLSDAVLAIEGALGTGWSGDTVMDVVTTHTSDISTLQSGRVQYTDLTGMIVAFAGSTAPTGWLLCDGSAVSRSTYADLFALVSTTYGAGNGTTTFNVPDLKGRVPVGKNSSDTEFDALGESGGAKTHTLTTTELAAHTHTGPSHTHTGTTTWDGAHHHNYKAIYGANPGGSGNTFAVVDNDDFGSAWSNYSGSEHAHNFTTAAAGTGATGSAGSGGAHNNLQPYLTINYIIKT